MTREELHESLTWPPPLTISMARNHLSGSAGLPQIFKNSSRYFQRLGCDLLVTEPRMFRASGSQSRLSHTFEADAKTARRGRRVTDV